MSSTPRLWFVKSLAKILITYTQSYCMDTQNMIALGCQDCRLKYLLAPFGLSVVLCGIASTFLSILSSDESFFLFFYLSTAFLYLWYEFKGNMGYDSIKIERHSCERQYERNHAKSNHIRFNFDYGCELVMKTDFYISNKNIHTT